MSRWKVSPEEELTFCIVETFQLMRGYVFTQLKIDVSPKTLVDSGSNFRAYQEAHPDRYYVFMEDFEESYFIGRQIHVNFENFDSFFKNKVQVFYDKKIFKKMDIDFLKRIEYNQD